MDTRRQKLTLEHFVNRSIQVHGVKYNYSKVVLNGCDRKVIIICPDHGEFEQTPYNHYNGQGCHKCGRIKASISRKHDLNDVLQRCKELHNDKYDYDAITDSNYENLHTKVPIRCSDHGIFHQALGIHLRPTGCPDCGIIQRSNAQRLGTEEFIRRSKVVHGDKYLYTHTVYISGHIPVIITCRIHGDFEQDPYNHMSSNSYECCGYCNGKTVTVNSCIQDFKMLHGDLYDYTEFEKVGYKSAITPIPILCKKDGIFFMSRNCHLRPSGCPTCTHKTEAKLLRWIISLFGSTQNKRFAPSWCHNPLTGRALPFDYFIECLSLIIELDGRQHFVKTPGMLHSGIPAMKRDVYKMRCANQNGMRVIRLLQQDVWDNDESWLDANLKPLLVKKDARENEYIGDIYHEHRWLMTEGTEIDPSEFYDEEE